MLLVTQKIGAVLLGAFDRGDDLIGFVYGLTGLQDTLVHWSHMLAVRPDWQDRGVGQALKWAQRDRAVAMGIETMLWTFDPLVSRNAHVNLTRLGVRVREYVPNLYGLMASRTDAVIGSDRLIVAWALGQPTPSPATAPGDVPLIRGPEAPLPDAPTVLLAVPVDVQQLKEEDPDAARAWRRHTRTAFTHYLGAGYVVRGFARDAAEGPAYVLELGID
jgi:predicted GNAT superfamily acetyltransferase